MQGASEPDVVSAAREGKKSTGGAAECVSIPSAESLFSAVGFIFRTDTSSVEETDVSMTRIRVSCT